jgi:hypothetical protein
MWSSSSPVRIRTRLPWRSVAHSGVTSLPSAADSQAKRGPRPPLGGGQLPGRAQPPDPVLEHRPGRDRMDGGQHRQHEHVSVPEHVAGVDRAAQAAGADGRLSRAGRRGEHMEQGEPDSQLGVGPRDAVVAALLEADPVPGIQQRTADAQGAGGPLGPHAHHPWPSQGGEPQGGAVGGATGPPQHPIVQVQLATMVAGRGSGLESRPDRARQQRRSSAGVVVDAGGEGQGRRPGAALLAGPAGAEAAVGQGAQRLGHPLQPWIGVHRHRPVRVAAVGRVHRALRRLPQDENSRVLPGSAPRPRR